jgi:hypothetical protein
MSNLVEGHTGLIHPQNLATNGNFLIHQRGETISQLYPRQVGDYVADCWKVIEMGVDSLSTSWHENGWIRLSGTGKKGSTVVINNRDTSNQGHGAYYDYTTLIYDEPQTATIQYRNDQAESSNVSLKFSPSYSTNTKFIKDGYTLCTVGAIGNTDSVIFSCGREAIVNAPSIRMYLEEDGEFNIYLYRASIYAGAYNNPPRYAPVPYADDLARCQRYYQKGIFYDVGVWSTVTTNHSHRYFTINLKTDMVSIPTVSNELIFANVYDGANGTSDQKAIATTSNTYASVSEFRSGITIDDATYGPRALTNGVDVHFSWTAEVV